MCHADVTATHPTNPGDRIAIVVLPSHLSTYRTRLAKALETAAHGRQSRKTCSIGGRGRELPAKSVMSRESFCWLMESKAREELVLLVFDSLLHGGQEYTAHQELPALVTDLVSKWLSSIAGRRTNPRTCHQPSVLVLLTLCARQKLISRLIPVMLALL